MNKRVLFVDDEPNVLQAIKRAIRKEVDVSIAVGPEAGLEMVSREEPFALIVSDMRMPGMNGVEFLRAAKQISPNSVRIMLTGNSDQQTAVDAVNDGQVFRFLTKPCDVNVLRHVIAQGLRQYELVNAERELLDQTVKGSIGLLAELLSLARPEAFGRSCRIKDQVMALVANNEDLKAEERWAIETAAMLSQLGNIMMPRELITKLSSGQALRDSEQQAYVQATASAAKLIANVPRMESVANIVNYQHKHYDGGGFPADGLRAEAIPYGARALHLALAIDEQRARGVENTDVAKRLGEQRSRFDPRMLELITKHAQGSSERQQATLQIDEMRVGMRIEQDIVTDYGSLLVCEGQTLTEAVLAHLMRFFKEGKLTGSFRMTLPANDAGLLKAS